MANGIIPGSSRTVAGGDPIPAQSPNTPEVLLLSSLAGLFEGANKQRQLKQTQQASFLNAIAPTLVSQGQLSTVPGTPDQQPINPGSTVPLFPSGGATVADLLQQQGGLGQVPLNRLDEFKTLVDLQQSLAPPPEVSPQRLQRAVDRSTASRGLISTTFDKEGNEIVKIGDVDTTQFTVFRKGGAFAIDDNKLTETINRTIQGEQTGLTISQAQSLKRIQDAVKRFGKQAVIDSLRRNGASQEQIELVSRMEENGGTAQTQ